MNWEEWNWIGKEIMNRAPHRIRSIGQRPHSPPHSFPHWIPLIAITQYGPKQEIAYPLHLEWDHVCNSNKGSSKGMT